MPSFRCVRPGMPVHGECGKGDTPSRQHLSTEREGASSATGSLCTLFGQLRPCVAVGPAVTGPSESAIVSRADMYRARRSGGPYKGAFSGAPRSPTKEALSSGCPLGCKRPRPRAARGGSVLERHRGLPLRPVTAAAQKASRPRGEGQRAGTQGWEPQRARRQVFCGPPLLLQSATRPAVPTPSHSVWVC